MEGRPASISSAPSAGSTERRKPNISAVPNGVPSCNNRISSPATSISRPVCEHDEREPGSRLATEAARRSAAQRRASRSAAAPQGPRTTTTPRGSRVVRDARAELLVDRVDLVRGGRAVGLAAGRVRDRRAASPGRAGPGIDGAAVAEAAAEAVAAERPEAERAVARAERDREDADPGLARERRRPGAASASRGSGRRRRAGRSRRAASRPCRAARLPTDAFATSPRRRARRRSPCRPRERAGRSPAASRRGRSVGVDEHVRLGAERDEADLDAASAPSARKVLIARCAAPSRVGLTSFARIEPETSTSSTMVALVGGHRRRVARRTGKRRRRGREREQEERQRDPAAPAARRRAATTEASRSRFVNATA